MHNRRAWRAGLLTALLASLASGIILAVAGRLLTSATVLGVFAGSVPTWLFLAVIPAVALLAFGVAWRLVSAHAQAFVLISAFTQTRWLTGLLEDLSRSLDRHDIDLVVKLPQHDHSGRSQLQQIATLRKKRRAYLGSFIIFERPEHVRPQLVALCREIGRPVVFIDVRPFGDAEAYPPRSAFVGCSAGEIGERAAQVVGKELLDRGVEAPRVLVVAAESQGDRQARFTSTLREILPSAAVDVTVLGLFARERAREIVDRRIRHLGGRGERLDAIFCTNDEMALGAVDAVQQRIAAGGSVDDLVILGVDGIAEATAAIQAGTTAFQATIVQDTRRLAEVAVDILLRLRAGERVPSETFIPTTVYPMQ